VVPLTEEMDLDIATTPQVEEVAVALNKAHLIPLAVPIRDVVVANPEIADVIVKTPRQVYVVAQAIGETNIFFITAEGEVVKHVVVIVEVDLASARAAIRALLPDAAVHLRNLNGNVVITGSVRSAKESADIAAIIQRFVGEEGGEAVLNMLRITEDQQVLLKVRVAEISRTVLKTLGFDTDITPNIDFDAPFRDRAFSLDVGLAPFLPVSGSILIDELGFGAVNFATLETQGLAKTLAEPVLTAISGETANFLAGGEVAVPTSASLGVVAFTFKQFGVILSFTPVVLSENQISLRVVVEVSRPDPTLIVTADAPFGFSTNRAETTVTLPSGGSVMIAGLLQSDETNTIDGVPGFEDLPIIGALFRSTEFERSETELVITVTPYRVRSVDNRRRMSMPTDGFLPASDIDVYLFGQLHKRYTDREKLDEVPSVFGPIGYTME
jgi:pilus assembly protein CpaC